nr:putative general secretory pathway protein D [uncultured bacterium]
MHLQPRIAVYTAYPLLAGLMFLAGSLGGDSTSPASKVPPEQTPRIEGAANVPTDQPILSPILLDSERESEARIRRAMQTRIQDWPSEIALAGLADQLSKIGNIHVSFDPRAFKDEEVDLTQKITRKVKGASIESALNRILPNMWLDWIIKGEALEITTHSAAREFKYTRNYNLRPLRLLFEAHPERMPQRNEFGPQGTEYGGGFGGRGKKSTSNENLLTQGIVDKFEKLFYAGWESPSITVLNGTDLVSLRHDRRTHDRFASYLRALEAIVDGTASKGAVKSVPLTYPAMDDEAINRKLRQKTSLQYHDVPLNQILADISRKNAIEIAIDQKAFGDEGIDVRKTLTCDLKDVTLHAGLKALFRGQNVDFYVAEGELIVTTVGGEAGQRVPVFYDVLDLLSGEVDVGMESIADLVVNGSSGNWMGGDIDECDAVFPGILLVQTGPAVHEEIAMLLNDLRSAHSKNLAGEQPKANDQKLETRFYNVAANESVDDVLAAVPQFVAPESWRTELGIAISKVGQTLVIRQTESVHQKIDKFLLTLKTEQEKSKRDIEKSK